MTTTTLREIYAQSRPKTQSFFLGHALKTVPLADIHPEVAEALHERGPAISLESTPATIGLTDERIEIGFEPRELERRAECKNKLPRRDTGSAFAFKRGGGTTHSATLVFATLASIKVRPSTIFSVTCFNLTFLQVFATGGYSVRLTRGAYMTLTGCVFLAWKLLIVSAKVVSSLAILSNTQADLPY